MRSRPATRTAFAKRESHCSLTPQRACRSSAARPALSKRRLATFHRNRPALRSAIALLVPRVYRVYRSQSRRARPFLRRPQRPGTHNAFTFLGTARQLVPLPPPNLAFQLAERLLRATAAGPAFAITGSATFTLAVKAMSRILPFRAMKNQRSAVRNLWRKGLSCGTRRKKRWKTSRDDFSARKVCAILRQHGIAGSQPRALACV